MRFTIREGDKVITLYDYDSSITPYKEYKVLDIIDGKLVLKNDLGRRKKYSPNIFFEIELFYRFNLFRIINLLQKNGRKIIY